MSESIENESRLAISNPFEQSEGATFAGKVASLASWGVAIAGGVVTYKYGFDEQLTILPPVYEQITDGIIAANQALRDVAPVVAAAGVVTHAGYRLAGRHSDRVSSTLDYSNHEYSGLDQSETRRGFRGFMRLAAGLGLAASAGVFIVSSTAIEQEVANGPIRAVTNIGDMFSGDTEQDSGDTEQEYPPVYFFDNSQAHFMNDSSVSGAEIDQLREVAPDSVDVFEFGRGLPNIQYSGESNTTGFLLSVPESFVETGSSSECSDVGVIADAAVGSASGEKLTIKEGLDVTVVGQTEGASSMNRSTLVMSNADFLNCFQEQNGEAPNYFGAVATGVTESEAQDMVDAAGLSDEVAVVTEERFINNNKDFWSANGTPILLQQIAYLGAFAGIALAGTRKNALQQNIREIGTMHANGVQASDMKRIETVRGLRQTAKSMLIAAPLAPVLAGVLNASVRGLEVGTSIRDLAVGYTVLLGSTVLSARRSIKKFFKSKTASEMIKG